MKNPSSSIPDRSSSPCRGSNPIPGSKSDGRRCFTNCSRAFCNPAAIPSSTRSKDPISPASFISPTIFWNSSPNSAGRSSAANAFTISASPGIGSATTMCVLPIRALSRAATPQSLNARCARSHKASAAICAARGSMSTPCRLCSRISAGAARRSAARFGYDSPSVFPSAARGDAGSRNASS